MLNSKQVLLGVIRTHIAKVTSNVALQERLRIHAMVIEMFKHAWGGKNLPQLEQGALALYLRGVAIIGWVRWVAHGNDSVKG